MSGGSHRAGAVSIAACESATGRVESIEGYEVSHGAVAVSTAAVESAIGRSESIEGQGVSAKAGVELVSLGSYL